MNRRDLFRAVGAAVVGGRTVGITGPTIRKYGRLTVEGHIGHRKITGETLHVYYKNADITGSCCEADDVEGYAIVFCRDEQHHREWTATGAIHVGDHAAVCKLRLVGDIRITPGDPL